MKKIILVLQLLIISSLLFAQETSNFTDTRDGQTYKIVKIGNQWWMAENLKAKVYSDGTPLKDGTKAGNITGDISSKYYFNYLDKESNAEKYGRLYTWAAVMNEAKSSNDNPSGIQGICPVGTHVPSDAEWKELELNLGMTQVHADRKEWRGTDQSKKILGGGSSGFNALYSGYFSRKGHFYGENSGSYFRTSTEYGNEGAWIRILQSDKEQIKRISPGKEYAYSVRCIIDPLKIKLTGKDITAPNGSVDLTVTGGLGPYKYNWSNKSKSEDISGLKAGEYTVTVTDAINNTVSGTYKIHKKFISGYFTDSRDGQKYKTIKIGDQVWMAENLNYEAPDSIVTEFTDSWCYDNDNKNCEKYGRLYSSDVSLKVCPIGWHLPDKEEYKLLLNNFGDSETDNKSGDYKKIMGKKQGYYLRNDDIGFNVLFAGGRAFLPSLNSEKDVFEGLDYSTDLWTSETEYGAQYSLELKHDSQELYIFYNDYDALNNAYSVRCVKDSDK